MPETLSVVEFAPVRPRDRLDRLAPSPAGLEDGAADSHGAHVVRLEPAERNLADVIGFAEQPALEPLHQRDRGTSNRHRTGANACPSVGMPKARVGTIS